MKDPRVPALPRRPFLAFALCLSLVASLAAVRSGSPAEPDCAHLALSGQLAQAAVESETRFIDLGTPEARTHLLSGWSIDERWQGKTTFVWAMGDSAALRFTRFSPGPFTLYFRCRPIDLDDAPPQEVMILVNGTRVGVTRLEAGFQQYQAEIPAGVLRSGENRLELGFAHYRAEPPAAKGVAEPRRLAVALDWIGFGVKSAPAAPLPQASPPAGSFSLPFLTRVDFYVQVQPGSSLRWQAIRPWRTERLGPGAALEVRVDWDGAPAGKPTRFEQPAFANQATIPLATDKAAFARISLLAWPGKSAHADITGLFLDSPEILAPGCTGASGGAAAAPAAAPSATPPAGAAVGATGAAGPGAGEAAPNVLVYMIDTLRADHLGVYGYGRPVSPEIDAFAAQATVFERAFSQSGWTKSSVASMLTGLHPLTHGVAERMDALPATVPTLPALLREGGYQTLGVSTNPAIAATAGFGRGFDRFVELFDPAVEPFVARPSEKVGEELSRWLADRDARRPFFAYLHTMDAHEPYLPPPAYRRRFAAQADAALCRPGPKDVAAALAARPALGRTGIRDNFEALYDAQIAHNDSQFGQVLRRLRDLGLYDKTLIVLVADHGEEFLDHGLFAHGHSLYQEILHVPLIVRWPDGRYAGRRVESPAQHIDLLPTILAAAGVALPPGAPNGLDLRQLAQGGAPVEREISSELSLAGTRIASLVSGGMHLLVRDSPNPGAELYDLRADPWEQRSVAGQASVRLGFMMSRLRTLARSQSRGAAPRRPPVADEHDKQLRSLGYGGA